jgi:hypothetical protein
LFGKSDNDALGPADAGKPVSVLVPHLAYEFGPVGAHARDDSVDVIDSEHDATERHREDQRRLSLMERKHDLLWKRNGAAARQIVSVLPSLRNAPAVGREREIRRDVFG